MRSWELKGQKNKYIGGAERGHLLEGVHSVLVTEPS